MASTKPAVTLLFCHGAGFCQGIWKPVISRLQATALIQRVSPHIVTFDFPYHGENRDVSQPAILHLENPTSPRVTHPAMYWSTFAPAEVHRQVNLIREQGPSRTPMIGIGHSMGAASLWATEAAHPGTFDGLVLFEPMANANKGMAKSNSTSFLVAATLQRRHQWNSLEEAKADIMSMRNFRRWHREALEGYADGAVVKVSAENNVFDPDAKYALSCHPHIEASMYSGSTIPLTDEEIARVKCPITFYYGDKSHLAFPELRQQHVDAHPHLYSLGEPVPNTTHTQVMEDPDTVVSRIVDSLAQLPPFNHTSSKI